MQNVRERVHRLVDNVLKDVDDPLEQIAVLRDMLADSVSLGLNVKESLKVLEDTYKKLDKEAWKDEINSLSKNFILPRTFLTGSRVYGCPKVESDLDMVVLMDSGFLNLLSLNADQIVGSNNKGGASFRFGKLNLIILTDPVRYMNWWEGTQELIRRRTNQGVVNKDDAIKCFEGYFEEVEEVNL